MEYFQNSIKFNQNNYQEVLGSVCFQDYYLIKDNIVYKIIIEKNSENIIIKCKNYLISFNEYKLSSLTKIKFHSIDNAYEFIYNIFEENKVIIENIVLNKEIKLLIKNNERDIELILKYNKNKNNNNIGINNIKQIMKEINNLKEENKKLKKEIEKLKKYHENSKNDIKLLYNLAYDSYESSTLDNSFTVFKSVNNILCLIYANVNKSIISYDLNNRRKINEIKNCHNEYISNFRYYYDDINNRDLVMSISYKDNNIKIWNAYNWNCILNLINVNNQGFLYSACFMKKDKEIYIITSNDNSNGVVDPIKVFDLRGIKIKEINNSKTATVFIDTFYDYLLDKYYIVTGNNNEFSKSYDYVNNYLYHKYNDNNKYYNNSLIIKYNKDLVNLIIACSDGSIRIFNFHTALFLNKIQISSQTLYGMCLWNDNYLLVGCEDKTIKIVEIKSGLFSKSLSGHNNRVLSIKTIIHRDFGECFVSQNFSKSEIKLWKNEYIM